MAVARERYSVFLLAQNRLLRESLARIMGKKSDVEVVGACAFSPTVLEQIAEASPDVLLMDSFTSGLAHLQFIREVQRAVSEVRVVLIGMEEDEQLFLQAVREGASGYVLQDASALEVLAAFRSVVNGDAVCPPQLCSSLFNYVARQSNMVPNYQARVNLGLTNREQQIMLLIGRGLTNKEIAGQLQLAEQTVRNHVHRIFRKMGATNRMAAVEMCRMQGLPV
jgi:two-component system NarL family response regulator